VRKSVSVRSGGVALCLLVVCWLYATPAFADAGLPIPGTSTPVTDTAVDTASQTADAASQKTSPIVDMVAEATVPASQPTAPVADTNAQPTAGVVDRVTLVVSAVTDTVGGSVATSDRAIDAVRQSIDAAGASSFREALAVASEQAQTASATSSGARTPAKFDRDLAAPDHDPGETRGWLLPLINGLLLLIVMALLMTSPGRCDGGGAADRRSPRPTRLPLVVCRLRQHAPDAPSYSPLRP
jgi:hypothetical protein